MPADPRYDVVHELTKGTEKYGCDNRQPFSHGYYAQDRQYNDDGTYQVVQTFIPHKMSTECHNFYLWNTDPKCAGCRAPKSYQYAKRMQAIK